MPISSELNMKKKLPTCEKLLYWRVGQWKKTYGKICIRIQINIFLQWILKNNWIEYGVEKHTRLPSRIFLQLKKIILTNEQKRRCVPTTEIARKRAVKKLSSSSFLIRKIFIFYKINVFVLVLSWLRRFACMCMSRCLGVCTSVVIQNWN